uniref:transmembrane protein 81 isoform X2 n=1 Tax=Doryrhamphus excisus TaxID=161450 RepID=UPI0025AE8394|nr:transmembrane protein 81 isoform X2 [Doryrhamphus excisus]
MNVSVNGCLSICALATIPLNFQQQVLAFPVFLLLLLFLPLSWADVEKVQVQVVTNSTPCSVTCGLGVKVQRVCSMRDAESEDGRDELEPSSTLQVTEECRDEKVKCMESWQCGLTTFTVTTGERVELDCLVENAKMMEKLSWRVSWSRAPGVISSDNALFTRWHSPRLDLLVLDPVEEQHAGTYRCDVLDADNRRLKTAYWGVRVLPRGVLNLDYDHGEGVWESGWVNPTVPIPKSLWVIYVMLPLLCIFDLAVMVALAVMIMKNKDLYRVDEDDVADEEKSEGGSLHSESTV